jgi:YYY domain-containing protein
MSEALRWWLILLVVGAVTLPLCHATFRRLPDRGYTLSKAFGLLFLGFTFWFLNSIHVLPNERGGIIAALLLLAVVGGVVAWREREGLREWYERNWVYALAVEMAFLLVFAIAVWLRSEVGQIIGTEQPMDLMFINATMRADYFPPQDPWLSGHNVAYYYFGYLLIGMMGTLTGVPGHVAYNIGLGTIASLALLTSFGIVYNLVRMREDVHAAEAPRAEPARAAREQSRPSRRKAPVAASESGSFTPPGATLSAINWKPYVFGVGAALMLIVMGNFVWVLKYASALGFGGDGFYDWVGVQGLKANEPMASGKWYPTEYFGFFDASRIIPLNDDDFYVITEFPMFSFILGDIHPHVMALPFVLLAVALALALYRTEEPLDVAYWLSRPLMFVGAAVMLGALAFINTWDIATISFVLVAAVFLSNWLFAPAHARDKPQRGLSRDDWLTLGVVGAINVAFMVALVALLTPGPLLTVGLVGLNVLWLALFAAYLSRGDWPDVIEAGVETVSFALPLIMLAVLIYAPFYRSFTSQADGILPVVTREGITEPGTRPFHAFLYWGPLFAVVLPFVAVRLFAMRDRITRRDALIAGAVPVAIVLAWALLFAVTKATDDEDLATANDFFKQIGDRGTGWITAIIFGVIVSGSLLTLWLELTSRNEREERMSRIFALLLAATAFLLILGCEFFYVGDVFNARMNTVFKLYYQAWLLLALAGGFALYHLISSWKTAPRDVRIMNRAWAAIAAVALAGAALYPFGAVQNRLTPYDGDGDEAVKRAGAPEIEGLDGLKRWSPGEREAVAKLTKLAQGQDIVIAEAAGSSYTDAGRIAAATGAPSVLGWPGHEDQWRGSVAPRAGRFEDLERLWRSTSIDEARQIVDKYGITHIYVGSLERSTYGGVEGALEKFSEFPVAFQTEGVIVYQAEGVTPEEASSSP